MVNVPVGLEGSREGKGRQQPTLGWIRSLLFCLAFLPMGDFDVEKINGLDRKRHKMFTSAHCPPLTPPPPHFQILHRRRSVAFAASPLCQRFDCCTEMGSPSWVLPDHLFPPPNHFSLRTTPRWVQFACPATFLQIAPSTTVPLPI